MIVFGLGVPAPTPIPPFKDLCSHVLRSVLLYWHVKQPKTDYTDCMHKSVWMPKCLTLKVSRIVLAEASSTGRVLRR